MKKVVMFGISLCFVLISCNSNKEISNPEDYLSIHFNDVKIDNDITRIFYGITANGKCNKTKDLPLLITMRNGTNKVINPSFLMINFHARTPVKISRYYKIVKDEIIKKDSDTYHNFDLYYDNKVLFPYQSIPFPITEIETGEMTTVLPMTILWGTALDNLKEVKMGIITYPLNVKRYLGDYIETDFLKITKEFINWEKPEQNVLAFDSIIVPRLTNYQLLKPEKFKVRHLEELLETH